MVWVKSEYAGELAVVSAWLSALLPWWVSYTPDGPPGGSVLYMRFSVLQARYFLGVSFGENIDVDTFMLPWNVTSAGFSSFQSGVTVWYVGGVVLLAAVVLSLWMYVDYEGVLETLPIHPVRAMGGLLTGAGAVFATASVVFYLETPFSTEYPLPVGVLLMLVLGTTLLRVDLIDAGPSDTGEAEQATG